MTNLALYAFEDTGGEIGLTPGTSNGITTANPRVGVASLALGGVGFATLAVGASPSNLFIGFPVLTGVFIAVRFLEFREGATVHCGVGTDATGHLTIYGAAGTVLNTSAAAIPLNAWADIEAHAVIHDTTGSVEVKLDGVVVVSVTNVDTKNGGTGVCDTIGLRKPNSSGSSTLMSVDCMYINDNVDATVAQGAANNTYWGDIAVRFQLADSNGDSSDFVGSDGNSVNNFQQVDDLPFNDADYNGTSLTAKTDLYGFVDIPSTDVVLATQLVIRAAKSDAGTPPVLKPVVKGDGGTVIEETAVTLSTTYQFFQGAIRSKDPDGDALTPTNVNGMQIGARSA